MTNADAKHNNLKKQTILEHINDLRKLIVISVGSIFICFLIIFLGFSEQLMNFIIDPLKNKGIEVIYIAIAEAFSIQMKTAFVAGTILASPIVIFQIWYFIRPALYKDERLKFTLLYISAIILFATGVIFAYTTVFHIAVRFFLISGEALATPMISIDRYVNFLFSFLIPFGVVFQLPIAIIILTQNELISLESLKKYRKYVIFTAFVSAAIITPPDFVSQIMLGVPIVILYEVGIIISRLTKK